jgi:hypothetical protein
MTDVIEKKGKTWEETDCEIWEDKDRCTGQIARQPTEQQK